MKSRLILCNGWRGVRDRLLETLRERSDTPLALRETLLLVPTAAAAHLLRAALERNLLEDRPAAVLPAIATPSGLFEKLVARSLGRVRRVDPLLREALLRQAFAEAAEAGVPPPFAVGGALAAETLSFQDEFFDLGGSLQEFTERALAELEVPEDLGAERMAAQTRFLRESLRRLREKLEARRLSDPASLRQAPFFTEGSRFPYRRVLALGPETLSPPDLAFLSAAPGLSSLEILVPSRMEEHFRLRLLRRAAPLEVVRDSPSLPPPRLLHPAPSATAFVARDREEALIAVARLLKSRAAEKRLPPLDRIAVVVPRPLPYLYLARQVFSEAGIPHQLQNDFPLASEPYAAAVDSILDFVERDGSRSAALALLRNPFFHFADVGPEAVAALDRLLATRRSPGGRRFFRRELRRFERRPRQPALPGLTPSETDDPALAALTALVRALEASSPLADPASSITEKIATLRGFLEEFGRRPADLAEPERHQRARGAVLDIFERLASAAGEAGDCPLGLPEFRAAVRRAIESHTFSIREGRSGVQVVDARSAGYGDFDLVLLLGLNEGEWPARPARNIFYPQWLLGRFSWTTDREFLSAERSAFVELVRLASQEVALLRHQLEEDLPTVESPFLEEVEASALERQPLDAEALERLIISRSQALRVRLAVPAEPLPPARRRAGVLATRLPEPSPVSATAFELYLACPFKYYSRHVLRIEEEEDLEEGPTPRQRGLDLHLLLRNAFARWDGSGAGPRPVTPENYPEAVALFRQVAEEILPSEGRALEMQRLFGSPGQTGEIEWILRSEMAREAPRERLLEFPFQGVYALPVGGEGGPWEVRVKGQADRVDRDSSGLRLFDYKSGKAPETRNSLQLPLYALCLERELSAPVIEASYLSLRERREKSFPLKDVERAAGTARQVFEKILAGELPPRPDNDRLCATCGYAVLCRKEIQEAR
jgi:inactivated superfamily I helicase